MKKILVIVMVLFGLVFAGLAEAAPKKRTRNQNRIGPYGAAFVGMTGYKGDQTDNESIVEDILTNNGIPFQNLDTSTDDSDFGFQATFGYRFHRYFAAELGLVQYGELTTSAGADLDIPDDGLGFVPTDVEMTFSVGGPLISAMAILPIQDKFELYGRVGYLFASTKREISLRVEGERAISGSGKGDAQELVYGAGFSWNINQVYSMRAEYQVVSDVGSERTGTEDLGSLSLGLIIRF